MVVTVVGLIFALRPFDQQPLLLGRLASTSVVMRRADPQAGKT
jgi:hypothetical protein